jgi:hypothetical protein
LKKFTAEHAEIAENLMRLGSFFLGVLCDLGG